jgi:hypothetical protein
METNNSILFEMRMLNDLRKLKHDQRKELVETLEREDKLNEEALQKNPNLHVEQKLAQVLGELKDIRTEMQVLKNTCQYNASSVSNFCNMGGNRSCVQVCPLVGLEDRIKCQNIGTNQDDDSSDCNECSIFSGSIDWWPIIIFVLIFLSLLSLPGSKSIRPCPINI